MPESIAPPPLSSTSPLPLAASLQTTLHVLVRRLGHLLSVQSRLQGANADDALRKANPAGWQQLALAAQKWQRDVTALNTWVAQAQEALAIEYQRAQQREQVEAAQAAELALKQAQAQEQEQAQARERDNEANAKGAAVNDDNNDDDDDDDDDKPLGSRDAQQTTATGDDKAQQLGDQQQQQQAQPHPNAEFDFTSLGLPGFDMNALIDMAQQSQSQSQQPQQQQSSQPAASTSTDQPGAGTITPFMDGNFDMSNFDLMSGDTEGMSFGQGNDGSGHNHPDDDNMGMSGMGMDFGAALEGVDWSSLLENMGGVGSSGAS